MIRGGVYNETRLATLCNSGVTVHKNENNCGRWTERVTCLTLRVYQPRREMPYYECRGSQSLPGPCNLSSTTVSGCDPDYIMAYLLKEISRSQKQLRQGNAYQSVQPDQLLIRG